MLFDSDNDAEEEDDNIEEEAEEEAEEFFPTVMLQCQVYLHVTADKNCFAIWHSREYHKLNNSSLFDCH